MNVSIEIDELEVRRERSIIKRRQAAAGLLGLGERYEPEEQEYQANALHDLIERLIRGTLDGRDRRSDGSAIDNHAQRQAVSERLRAL